LGKVIVMPETSHSQDPSGDGSSAEKLAEISRQIDGLRASLNEKIDRVVDGRKAINVDYALGALQASLTLLGRKVASDGEKIDRVLQWFSNVPNLEKNVEKIMSDLNQLGHERVAKLEAKAGTIKTLAWIAVSVAGAAVTLLIFFLHFLEKHIQFKP
jgi:hypothetical protein